MASHREYPANASPEDVQEIFDLRRNVAERRAEYIKAKSEAKQAKSEWEEAGEDLIVLIDRIQNPQRELPFGPPGTSPIDHAIEMEDKARDGKSKPAPPTDESWRKVNIKELKLGDKIQDNLEDAGLFTIGQIADFTAKDQGLTDIGGIGPAKAQKIEDALTEFWKRWKPESQAEKPKTEGGMTPLPFKSSEDQFEPPKDQFDPPKDWDANNDRDDDND